MPDHVSPVLLDGEVVGTWRTGSDSPLYGNIGGAILRSDIAVDGARVTVEGAPATVMPWGLYDPQKKRPRS